MELLKSRLMVCIGKWNFERSGKVILKQRASIFIGVFIVIVICSGCVFDSAEKQLETTNVNTFPTEKVRIFDSAEKQLEKQEEALLKKVEKVHQELAETGADQYWNTPASILEFKNATIKDYHIVDRKTGAGVATLEYYTERYGKMIIAQVTLVFLEENDKLLAFVLKYPVILKNGQANILEEEISTLLGAYTKIIDPTVKFDKNVISRIGWSFMKANQTEHQIANLESQLGSTASLQLTFVFNRENSGTIVSYISGTPVNPEKLQKLQALFAVQENKVDYEFLTPKERNTYKSNKNFTREKE